MSQTKPRVLVFDPDESHRLLIQRALSSTFDVRLTSSLADAIQALASTRVDVVVSELVGADGLTVLRQTTETCPAAVRVLLSIAGLRQLQTLNPERFADLVLVKDGRWLHNGRLAEKIALALGAPPPPTSRPRPLPRTAEVVVLGPRPAATP